MSNISFRAAFLAAAAMFALASLDGVAHAGEYEDRIAKQMKSMERAEKKMAKLQACAADPKPCAQEEADKAEKALARATAKAEKAKALLASTAQ